MEGLMFDENAYKAIKISKEEAYSRGEAVLTTGYVLLGLLKTFSSVAYQTLIRFAVHPEKVAKCLNSMKRETTIIRMNKQTTKEEIEILNSEQTEAAFMNSKQIVEKLELHQIRTEHILIGLLQIPDSEARRVIESLGIQVTHIEEKIKYLLDRRHKPIDGSDSKPVIQNSILEELSVDITALAKKNKLDPVYGRQKEIKRAISILMRRNKNNPVFIGEPGVGKTALVEGIAQEIVKGNVPKTLRNKRILSLEMGVLLAGTKFRGEFEDRLKKIVHEVRWNGNIILFIDEIHTLIGAGSAEGAIDAANILKPALSRGGIQCIGATTYKEYRFIENDGALERRFQPIKVEEPSVSEAEQILLELRSNYENHHGIKISEEAVKHAVYLSARYITDRYLPDKSIDLIDEAAARLRLDEFQNEVLQDDLTLKDTHISQVLSEWTGIPLTRLEKEEKSKLFSLKDELKKEIIGQDHAVTKVVDSIIRSRTGLKNPKQPVGSFLFVGPSGVGKTLLAKLLAKHIFGDEKAIIRIDMSEYMEAPSISRLIGAAPGLVGYEEGGQLTEKVRKTPYAILLFDELEKGHVDFVNILLQILEDGYLTDSKGRTVDFSNLIIIFTSNISFGKNGNAYIGFNTNAEKTNELTKYQLEKLKEYFKPEFLSRIDEIIEFNKLTPSNFMKITEMFLEEVVEKLNRVNIKSVFSNHVKYHI